MKVIRIADFKGRKKLKEHYKDFIYCPECMGIIHWKFSPCLSKVELKEAITFPIYRLNGHPYYWDEKVMIDVARYNGVIE